MANPDHRDAAAFLADITTPPDQSVRINLMPSADLVAAIDRVARNRPQLLAQAAASLKAHAQ